MDLTRNSHLLPAIVSINVAITTEMFHNTISLLKKRKTKRNADPSTAYIHPGAIIQVPSGLPARLDRR